MGNQPGVFKSFFSPRIKSGHIRIMVFLNVKEIDKRCTTISGNAAIPRCGGELVFLINSLLDTARNSLATKSYCFLLFSLAGIAQAWGLRTGYQSHVKKTSLSPCEQKEWLMEQAENGSWDSSMHCAANKLTSCSLCYVFLPYISPSCLLVICFLKNEATGHAIKGRDPKNC